ncbi:vitamin K epoxide reductase family protein [Winogradskyella flava]|uniref:Thioredoxin domain-containing protein n=1 Tax=Winogradskyella flava TaxID=1884876 RepID=A0A842IKM7_9FLAO|nr:vitamin K epoxide reductase family protein [Winogradskyella flava]MBC2843500.1 thioredoxin domain-containing protein [Winogradskyella flava]
MRDTLNDLLRLYLNKIDIHTNKEELEFQLLSHPSYPSLHAVTGVLDHFRIDNLAAEVPTDLETFNQLPEVFFTLIKNGSKEFVVVTKDSHQQVGVHYHNKEKKPKPIEEFIAEWSGIVVIAEKSNITVEKKGVSNKNFIKSISIISLALLLFTFFSAKPSLFQIVHFILSLIGVLISILIIQHEFGFQSKAVEKLCTGSKSTSCEVILNSKGANFSKYIKLSDLSFIYFAGMVLSWVIVANVNHQYLSIVVLTICSIPITFYSLFYQYKIAKKWCPLCLMIIAVLWLQCLSVFLLNPNLKDIHIEFSSTLVISIMILVCTAGWLFSRYLLNKEQELNKLQIDHYRFRRNFDLFKAVYQKQEQIITKIIDVNEIIFGDKNAPINVVLVTSPLCYYCKAAHVAIDNLLKQYPNDVKVTVRFNINIDDKKGVGYRVVHRLHELYDTNKVECLKAMHEAYFENANLEKWLVKWNEPSGANFDNTLLKQKQWCHNKSINFTPALFVNDKAYPKEYDKEDLIYFINDLVDQ